MGKGLTQIPTGKNNKISIINLTEKFYLKITNDYNDEVWNYSYKDSQDGRINIEWDDLSEVTTFTIKIYSSEQTGCKGESYKTLYLTFCCFSTISDDLFSLIT